MICSRCGNQIAPNSQFCPHCGAKVEFGNQNQKSNNSMLAIVISLSAALVIAAIVIVFLVMKPHNEQAAQPSEIPTAAATAVPAAPQQAPAAQAPAQAPQQPVSDGFYNPSLTYKRMPEINQSVPSGTGMNGWAQSVIENFDYECEAYMNGNGGIPSTLLSGSTAYNQQTAYKQKHPTLTQHYTLIDAQNVREYGSYYYIWVHEIINQTENGVGKTDDSHWVYKVTASGMIVDYTADPAYK